MLTEYPLRSRTGDVPLVADCTGLEPEHGTLRCPGCGQRTRTLYVTPRKLTRCGHCFAGNSKAAISANAVGRAGR